ncbi:twin transmembrane helix small protein [Hirschia maritima]|uniref:twin transmembrane helix small protein n=1 Tax=Hirschia maritima TaxID=1121961 RepID=UPI0003684495|nr:twin transmembrane helix small protein [Hirschia maritima]
MTMTLSILLYIAIAAVFGILVAGLISLNTDSKSGKAASRSNKLMRIRVIAQAIAVAILVAIGFANGVIG